MARLTVDGQGVYLADNRYENLVIKCLYCGAYFSSEVELSRHVESAPPINYLFKQGDTFQEFGFDEFPPGRSRKVDGKILQVLTRNLMHCPFYLIEWSFSGEKERKALVVLQTALDRKTEEYYRRRFDCEEQISPKEFGL